MNKIMYLLLSTLILIVYSSLSIAQNVLAKLSENLEIRKISENIFIHISYYDLEDYKHVPANGLIIRENDKAYIIDTPWTNNETRMLIAWLEDSLKVKVEGVIATHWHMDCMGGLDEVKRQQIPTFAHNKTIEIAKSKSRPIPDTGFQDSLRIHLDGREIICRYFGAGHTVDNIFVWIPKEKILFAGCPVKALNWKSLGFIGDADLEAWPKTLKKVLETYPDCQTVIPGHGDIGGTNLIDHMLDLLEEHQSKNNN